MHYHYLEKIQRSPTKNITFAKISKYLIQTKFSIGIEISQILIKRNIRSSLG